MHSARRPTTPRTTQHLMPSADVNSMCSLRLYVVPNIHWEKYRHDVSVEQQDKQKKTIVAAEARCYNSLFPTLLSTSETEKFSHFVSSSCSQSSLYLHRIEWTISIVLEVQRRIVLLNYCCQGNSFMLWYLEIDDHETISFTVKIAFTSILRCSQCVKVIAATDLKWSLPSYSGNKDKFGAKKKNNQLNEWCKLLVRQRYHSSSPHTWWCPYGSTHRTTWVWSVLQDHYLHSYRPSDDTCHSLFVFI